MMEDKVMWSPDSDASEASCSYSDPLDVSEAGRSQLDPLPSEIEDMDVGFYIQRVIKDGIKTLITQKLSATGKAIPKEEENKAQPEQLSYEDEERRRIRRIRNKEAAQKCRSLKRQKTDRLEQDVEKLEGHKSDLKAEIEELERQKEALQDMLDLHVCVHKTPRVCTTQNMHAVPSVHTVQNMLTVPSVHTVQNMHTVPSVHTVQNTLEVPSVHTVQSMPTVQGVHTVPSVPDREVHLSDHTYTLMAQGETVNANVETQVDLSFDDLDFD